jgi:hypothetical protein
MARIKEYTSSVQATGQINARRATAADFGGDGGLADLAVAAGNFAQQMQQRETESEVSDIRTRMAQANADWTEQYVTRQQAATPGDMSFAPTLKRDMASYFEEMSGTIKTQKGRELFQQLSANISGNFMEKAVVHQSVLAGQKAKLDYVTALDANQRTLVKDPSQYEGLLAESLAALDDPNGPYARLSPIVREELKVKTRIELAAPTVDSIIESPGGAREFIEMVKPRANTVRANGVPVGGVPGATSGAGNFKMAVTAVLAKEGGFNASDGNSKAPVNFGINQKANPDIDVKNLTREKAVELYKDRYWDKIGGDNLPPRVAMFAFDAAVNMGVDAAKKLISQSGGDLDKMVALRKAMYQDIVAKNPQQAKFLNGWISRTDKVAKEASGLPMEQSVAANFPEPAPDTKPLKTGLPAFDSLPYEVQLRKIQLAETRMNQEMAIMQSRVKKSVEDNQAEAMTTGIVRNPMKEREFIAAYGEAQGAEMYASYKTNVIDLGADVARVRGMSVSERQALLFEYQSKVQGVGADAAARRFDTLQRAVKLMDEALKKDPAAYVINSSNDVKSSFAKVSELMFSQEATPEEKAAATQDYALKATAEQKRLGVDRPVLLPDAHVDKIVSQFYQQQQGGQNAANLMQALATQWGKHWPEVYGQMAKKLPSAAVVIGAGMKPGPAALLAEAAALGKEELKKTLDSGATRDLGDMLRKEMEPFMSSMNAQNGGDQTANRVFEGAELLALRYIRSGMSAKDAAKQAYQDTVGEKYNMRGTYRIPVEHDAEKVERGAQEALRNLESFGLEVPPSRFNLAPEDARKTYIKSLKAHSKWVTAADETGLVLYNAFGSAVLGADGKPVKQTWAQLALRGEPVPEAKKPSPADDYIRQSIKELKGQNLQ